MGSKIFKTVIERKIDIFVSTFGSDSISIFKNEDNKLIHPGEYGAYRERCLKNILGYILNKDLAISDGFLITAQNSVSTQCDVIVYESNTLPLIDNEVAKFFPVEVIKSIGEIKSNLSQSNFEEALRKLAKNKMLFDERVGARNRDIGTNGEFDYPFSFLVCKKMDFNVSEINFDNIYSEIDRKYWHNVILSIEDGLLSYSFSFNEYSSAAREALKSKNLNYESSAFNWHYPLHIFNGYLTENETYKTKDNFIKSNKDNPYQHILFFLTSLQSALPDVITRSFDFVIYLDLECSNLFIEDS